jgi:hypothetical protein
MILGVVTRGEWDGHQGSWHDWGWLESAPGAEKAIELLVAACRLHEEVVSSELAGGDPTELLANAALVQAEFMRPGVILVSLWNGDRTMLDEFHLDGGCVYWR